MVLAIIQARMTSTRLPGKVLLPILDRPMLSWMIERVRLARTIDKIVLATSTDSSDLPIVAFAKEEGIDYSRGSLDDVMLRYEQAILEHGKDDEDIIVRLTGDCPLMDPAVIDTVVNAFKEYHCDYAANTAPPPGTYPDGMDVEVFSRRAFKRALQEAKKPSEREHVTFYFWQNPDKFKTYRHDLDKDYSFYRWTVDYPQDLELIGSIIKHFYKINPRFSMMDIIGFLEKTPGLLEKNNMIQRNQGWASAFEKDKKAGF